MKNNSHMGSEDNWNGLARS